VDINCEIEPKHAFLFNVGYKFKSADSALKNLLYRAKRAKTVSFGFCASKFVNSYFNYFIYF
jgi:hypothetical protein